MLIALSLLSLIGLAGLTLLDGVLRAQERTDGRLQRLGELQRAMYLLTLDFEQADADSLSVDGGVVMIRAGGVGVRYALQDGRLVRAAGSVAQSLVGDVAGAEWGFHVRGAGWRQDWPADRGDRSLAADAVSLTLTLGETAPGPRGRLRRVVELPAPQPKDPLAALGGARR